MSFSRVRETSDQQGNNFRRKRLGFTTLKVTKQTQDGKLFYIWEQVDYHEVYDFLSRGCTSVISDRMVLLVVLGVSSGPGIGGSIFLLLPVSWSLSYDLKFVTTNKMTTKRTF